MADLADGVPAGDVCGVLLQYPGASGRILDPRELAEDVAARGGKLVVAADLLALALLESPGELGADVVVGSSQRFGVPLFYGGPHAGYMAVAAGLERHLPGRLVGVERRRRGASGVPPRAADPRAAHPPRQGDLQHLHRPGAAGRGRVDVRRPPRPRGAAHDRAPHPPLRRRARRGAARGRRRGGARRVLRHRAGPGARPRRGGRRARRTTPGSSCAWSTPTTSGISCSERTGLRRRREGPGRLRRRRPASSTTSTPARPTRCRSSCSGVRRSSSTRCSTATGPRPRCCATCAGSRPATTRSTAA